MNKFSKNEYGGNTAVKLAKEVKITSEIHCVHKWTKWDLNHRSRVMQLMKQALYPQATTAGLFHTFMSWEERKEIQNI